MAHRYVRALYSRECTDTNWITRIYAISFKGCSTRDQARTFNEHSLTERERYARIAGHNLFSMKPVQSPTEHPSHAQNPQTTSMWQKILSQIQQATKA